MDEAWVSLLQNGMNPARGVLQMGRLFRNLTEGVSFLQKGKSPANGPLQMGRLFRNLGDAFLPAAVAAVQKGMKTAQGPLQIGKELRLLELEDSVVETGPDQ